MTSLDTLDNERTTAVAPLSVSIELADDIDVGRGDVLISGAAHAVRPVLARELDATVCWFVDTPLRAGDRLASSRPPRPCGQPCRSCTPGSIPKRSTS
ncbi:bifunctional enzyme CysN/CysC domain protein [Mycobacterium xenopi 3993]|nr:bifunctional enzyme CysN/CysC domain protein [Mycobacterium xenopi 3993]